MAKQISSPKGIFKYTHLNNPDIKGAERFGGAPEYKVTLVFDKDTVAAQKFMTAMDVLHQGALEAAQEEFDNANPKAKAAWKKKKVTEATLNPYFSDEVDEDGAETGRVEMRFKTKAEFKGRDGKMIKKSVPFIDGKGVTIPDKKRPLIYSGSEGRVGFSTGNVFIPKDADAYLGLYLNTVQITKLGASGGSNPFGADEDSGFDADELDEYEGKSKDDDDLDDDLDGADGDDDLDDEIPF